MKAIVTKYHGESYRRGSGVTADDGDGNRARVAWDPALNSDGNHIAAVRALCRKMGWTGSLIQGYLMKGGRMNGQVWVWRQEQLQSGLEIAVVKEGQ